MTDLTKIEKPFGLLDEEARNALRRLSYEGPVQVYGTNGWKDILCEPCWAPSSTYRAKVVPLTKPSINWDHVIPAFNYLWSEKRGNSFLTRSKPTCVDTWWTDGGGILSPDNFASFKQGTCDWKDSLVCRPD